MKQNINRREMSEHSKQLDCLKVGERLMINFLEGDDSRVKNLAKKMITKYNYNTNFEKSFSIQTLFIQHKILITRDK
jgi:hypothetical protein